MLDHDQRTRTRLKNLINGVTDSYLIQAGCFSVGDHGCNYTNFFLQRHNTPAIVVANQKGYESFRGIVFPITAQDGDQLPCLQDRANTMDFLRKENFLAQHKSMLLIPRSYIESQGIIDDLKFIMYSKLHFDQRVITKYQLVSYAEHVFYTETGKDLRQVRLPNYTPRNLGNVSGAKFEDQISFGNYQIDVVPMPS